jgi:hypothetical protein
MAEYQGSWKPDWGQPQRGTWIGKTFVPLKVTFEGIGLKGAPDVSAVFEIRDGVPEVVDFRITAKPSGRAVRTSDLNGWQPLEGLALNGFRQVGELGDREHGAWPPQDQREEWAVRADLEKAMARRRTPSTAELEEVAKVYRTAIHGKPTEAVQLQLGYSRRTAARRVEQARAAGILPPTTKGKVTG